MGVEGGMKWVLREGDEVGVEGGRKWMLKGVLKKVLREGEVGVEGG